MEGGRLLWGIRVYSNLYIKILNVAGNQNQYTKVHLGHKKLGSKVKMSRGRKTDIKSQKKNNKT